MQFNFRKYTEFAQPLTQLINKTGLSNNKLEYSQVYYCSKF